MVLSEPPRAVGNRRVVHEGYRCLSFARPAGDDGEAGFGCMIKNKDDFVAHVFIRGQFDLSGWISLCGKAGWPWPSEPRFDVEVNCLECLELAKDEDTAD